MTEPTLHFLDCPDAHGGHRMAWWQWGRADAPHVIVCVHGLSRQGRDFDVLARELVARRPDTVRVVCPDVAGRGQSDWLADPADYQIPHYAADLLRLLGHLRPLTLDWVGTSMGGLIGMAIAGKQLAGMSAARPPEGAKAPSGGSAAHAVASVGAHIRRLVLNDVGPTIQWQAMQRIGAYLGQAMHFDSLEQAADALWAISTGFGPHTREQWLAFTRPMLKPDAAGGFALHYDPAIAVPFCAITPEQAARDEATLWQLYDAIRAETLLLRGAQSDLLSAETARAMTQRGPRARLLSFEGVGHAPTLIAADQVRAVAGFLLDEYESRTPSAS